MIIRSHGVPKKICDLMERKRDPLCGRHLSFCKEDPSDRGGRKRERAHIMIVGNPEHPEVVGISGWAGGEVTIIQTKEEAAAVSDPGPGAEGLCGFPDDI